VVTYSKEDSVKFIKLTLMSLLMETQLIEFQNTENKILRGILIKKREKSSKGVIFISGFERNGTTEPKFKDLADRLISDGVPSLRFDFSGLGLSDGNFRDTTLDRWEREFSNAYNSFKSETGVNSVYVVAHSLGACVLGKYLEKNPNNIERAVLISPALNQKDLMRYWFVSGKMKKENPEQIIEWENYEEFLDEKEFQKDVNKKDKMSKYNFIGADYFRECSELDLSSDFEKYKDRFLHIHGENDIAVPIESLGVKFSNRIIVSGGDHDMERPNQRVQWVGKAIDYLIN